MMARNPSTTITAIAQWGKPESALFCWTLPDEDAVEVADDPWALVSDAEDAAARDEDDAAAADEEDMEEMTASAYVVSSQHVSTCINCCGTKRTNSCERGIYSQGVLQTVLIGDNPIEWVWEILPWLPCEASISEPGVIH
jgi:hypothetical protein